jgi:hypothetical protein
LSDGGSATVRVGVGFGGVSIAARADMKWNRKVTMNNLYSEVLRRQRVLILFSIGAAVAVAWMMSMSIFGVMQSPM